MDNKKRKYSIMTLVGGVLIVVVNIALLFVDDKGPNYLGFIAGVAFILVGIINLKKGSKVINNQQEKI